MPCTDSCLYLVGAIGLELNRGEQRVTRRVSLRGRRDDLALQYTQRSPTLSLNLSPRRAGSSSIDRDDPAPSSARYRFGFGNGRRVGRRGRRAACLSRWSERQDPLQVAKAASGRVRRLASCKPAGPTLAIFMSCWGRRILDPLYRPQLDPGQFTGSVPAATAQKCCRQRSIPGSVRNRQSPLQRVNSRSASTPSYWNYLSLGIERWGRR